MQGKSFFYQLFLVFWLKIYLIYFIFTFLIVNIISGAINQFLGGAILFLAVLNMVWCLAVSHSCSFITTENHPMTQMILGTHAVPGMEIRA